MSDQAVDLRRSARIVRQHLIVVVVLAVLGLVAGAAYSVLRPPQLASNALVVLSSSSLSEMATQAVIADSDGVLQSAVRKLDPAMSVLALHSLIQVKSLAPGVMSIIASGGTAAQAEHTANAVASSYIAYLNSNPNVAGKVRARLLQAAVSATGPSRPLRLVLTGVSGALLAALIGCIGVIAVGRRDRRLRLRDEIADAIGVPVLASVRVEHPTDAATWSRVLADYQPSATTAWRLHSALRILGFPELGPAWGATDPERSLTVLSLSSDRRALALGPQLAVYAAARGIVAALIIGPPEEINATAMLRAACAGPPSAGRPRRLRVAVAHQGVQRLLPDAMLTVVVTVVDGQQPRLADAISTNAVVLGVSPGAATAEDLARVAAAAASCGRHIDGILIADPDPADPTTGRVPQLVRPMRRIQPTRISGSTVPIQLAREYRR